MKVSVCLITYNQELFIAEAIESVLVQKTNFLFELVIGEDNSNDNTRQICETYAQKHPTIINLLPSEKNHGLKENFVRTYNTCKGAYIALLDGDDYWVDDNKLQIQSDFLDKNSSIVITSHNIWLKYN